MSGQPSAALQSDLSPTLAIAADRWVRLAGYLLDCLPTLLLLLVVWIPIAGIIMAGLVLIPYWLLRDVTGASLGKLLLGLRVVGKDGKPAPTGARILRNITLIPGPICMVIPLVGYFIAGPVAFVCILVEGIMLLTQGERLGDRLASTTVVKVNKSAKVI